MPCNTSESSRNPNVDEWDTRVKSSVTKAFSQQKFWRKSKRRRFLELLWFLVPVFRPRADIARRFLGRIAWNGLEICKDDMVHSIAFKSTHWIDMKGFEMLCGDNSFRITYTVTKGQGVLGRLVVNSRSFIPSGNILQPSKLVRLRSKIRIEPETWYSINIIINIHEYEMTVTTSGGCDGRQVIETDSGVIITYSSGLESCPKTNLNTGQIAGIVFYRIDPEEEEFLKTTSVSAIIDRRASVSTQSFKQICLEAQPAPEVNLEVLQTVSLPPHYPKAPRSLPPLGGIITPPIRTEEVLRQVSPYMYSN